MPKKTVNGKRVVFRESFPAGEFYDLPQKWAGADELEFPEWVAVMSRFIESWEFKGDPTDVKAWEALDAFKEVTPIGREINQFVIGLLADAKN